MNTPSSPRYAHGRLRDWPQEDTVRHTTGFAAEPGSDGRYDAHAVEPGSTTAVCGEQLDVVVDSDWRTVRVRRCRLCLRALEPHRTGAAS